MRALAASSSSEACGVSEPGEEEGAAVRLMHPPSIRPSSAQRQRICVDIGASLTGHCYFGKGFYLGNGLVFPALGK